MADNRLQIGVIIVGGIVAIGSAWRLLRNRKLSKVVKNKKYMSVQEVLDLGESRRALAFNDKLIRLKRDGEPYALVIGKLVADYSYYSRQLSPSLAEQSTHDPGSRLRRPQLLDSPQSKNS